ncbi:hypothetical protein GGF31_005108 [Allomyces arbusculus]|nr:hypothetical protein GGF31_005108 [Allomyces arbusculus]
MYNPAAPAAAGARAPQPGASTATTAAPAPTSNAPREFRIRFELRAPVPTTGQAYFELDGPVVIVDNNTEIPLATATHDPTLASTAPALMLLQHLAKLPESLATLVAHSGGELRAMPAEQKWRAQTPAAVAQPPQAAAAAGANTQLLGQLLSAFSTGPQQQMMQQYQQQLQQQHQLQQLAAYAGSLAAYTNQAVAPAAAAHPQPHHDYHAAAAAGMRDPRAARGRSRSRSPYGRGRSRSRSPRERGRDRGDRYRSPPRRHRSPIGSLVERASGGGQAGARNANLVELEVTNLSTTPDKSELQARLFRVFTLVRTDVDPRCAVFPDRREVAPHGALVTRGTVAIGRRDVEAALALDGAVVWGRPIRVSLPNPDAYGINLNPDRRTSAPVYLVLNLPPSTPSSFFAMRDLLRRINDVPYIDVQKSDFVPGKRIQFGYVSLIGPPSMRSIDAIQGQRVHGYRVWFHKADDVDALANDPQLMVQIADDYERRGCFN